jgi:hypothetical protein
VSSPLMGETGVFHFLTPTSASRLLVSPLSLQKKV